MKLSDSFYLLHYFHIHPPPTSPTRERLLNETRAASMSNVIAPIVLTQSRLDNH